MVGVDREGSNDTSDDFAEIDIHQATVEVIRGNDAKIRRLGAELAQGGPESLAVELVNVAKRQEGVLSEVPGLEDHARRVRAVRVEIERHYEID